MEIIKLNRPDLPDIWDYSESVKKTKSNIYKWNNLTVDIANELWIARKKLSRPGKKKDKTSDQKIQGWGDYCIEIGSSRGVVNRWLNNWFGNDNIHISNNSGESEWYTPPNIIESAREVMGCIDIDPATSEIANKNIQAPVYYTKETDGLTKSWNGNVWLNPPYGQPIITQFSEAVISKRNEYQQAIILINNATETKWMQSMMRISNAICFLSGRIKYLNEYGEAKNTPLQGQILLYIGRNPDIFINKFKKYGLCITITIGAI